MIVSDEEEFVFIHNPKCAGTTVRDSLKVFDNHDHWFWGQTKINERGIDKAHMSLNIVKVYFPEIFKLFESYFVFGVVRNPYKRIVSSYNEVFFKEFEQVTLGEISFDEYRDDLNKFILDISASDIKGWKQSHRHFILQKNMFYIGNKCYADVVLKLEELNQANKVLKHFSEKLSETSLSWRQKKNERKTLSIDLSTNNVLYPETVKKVNNLYRKDFDIFGYEML